ncbi:unnamed protein product [Effrenium voratum]|nr:unnamed protein product [Effrenium voratum]
MWSYVDLRSMRSLQSQSRSQHRLLKSQASLQRRVLATNRASHGSQAASGERPELPESEVDVLSRMTQQEFQELVAKPPLLDEGDFQAKLHLLSMERVPLRFDGLAHEQWVQVHIYNLSETFVGPNQMLTFSEGLAIGGAFHVGVEVYGAEWSYGVYGVACDPPRSETAHVYECSVYVGTTAKTRQEVAEILQAMCSQWRGRDYDVLSHNCCSFGRRFVEELGVGPMPLWVDRFARTLHAGREAGREAMEASSQAVQQAGYAVALYGHHAGQVLHKTVMEDVPVWVEVARPHVERAVVETQVFLVSQGNKAGQAIHRVVMHDVPVMVETARPYVVQAGEAVHRAVAEDAPKAVEAARPHIEQAVTTAVQATREAVTSAQQTLSVHAQLASEQLSVAWQNMPEVFGSASSSSRSSSSDMETLEAPTAATATPARIVTGQDRPPLPLPERRQSVPPSSLLASPRGVPTIPFGHQAATRTSVTRPAHQAHQAHQLQQAQAHWQPHPAVMGQVPHGLVPTTAMPLRR